LSRQEHERVLDSFFFQQRLSLLRLYTHVSSSTTGHNYKLACIVSRRRDTKPCKEKEWGTDWCFRDTTFLQKREQYIAISSFEVAGYIKITALKFS
jgi:hypothetical protein